MSSRWSQAQTARELALNPSTVSLYLSGKAVPSLTVLRLFAGLIGDRVLLPGESESGVFLRDGPRFLEEWESDVVTTLRRVDPEGRKRIVRALGDILDVAARPVRYRGGRAAEAQPLAAGITVEAVVDRLLQSGNTALTAADVAAEFLAQSEQRGASTQPRTPERAADPETRSAKPDRKHRTR